MTKLEVEHSRCELTISDNDFRQLMNDRTGGLMAVCSYLQRCALDSHVLTRPLLGRILSESSQLEELLDAYGARRNKNWYTLRHLIATAKSFANASYKILHVDHARSSYNLLEVEGDFAADTVRASLFCGNVIMSIASRLIVAAEKQGLTIPQCLPSKELFQERLPAGRLQHDRTSRKVSSAEETVAALATAFLNLAAESKMLHAYRKVMPNEYGALIPDPVSEEEIRQLEEKFHNLQSRYDTFVSDTDTEFLDPDLKLLRGHISIIFHLLEVATVFAHHYERHLMNEQVSEDTAFITAPLVERKHLLNALMEYCMGYCSKYLIAARELCQKMLRRYAEIDRITVPVPKYRGFHVRPSTMVAKITHHYGSEIQMLMEGEPYDASAPLDLFRANEAINAKKRRKLSEEISRIGMEIPSEVEENMINAVRQIVTALAAKGKVVIYERPLPLDEMTPHEGEPLAQFAVDEITRLLAMGKIDIESDICVTFVGDKRVLNDIRLLAENGYGEDNFGNNIPLPEKLAYLRR